jgi:phosphoenolpyruvate carboxylase
MASPINEREFRDIKSVLRHDHPVEVARRFGRHLAIVEKINSCLNFDRYRAIVKAEHPPIKRSLTDRVEILEHSHQLLAGRVDVLEERLKTQRASVLFHGDQSG